MTDLDTPTILPPSLDTSLAAHFQTAAQLHGEGKLLEASEELKRALQVKPDSPEAHFNLANVVRDAGEVALAAQGFRAAIEFAKAKRHVYPDAQINLADALRRLGRHKEAIVAIREALKLQPLRPEAHIGLALILIAQGKQSAAIARLQKAIKIAPDSVAALFQLGLALHWHSQWEEALEVYDRIKILSPDFLQARLERARTLFRLGRIGEGFAEYETRLQVPMLKRIQPADLKPAWDGKESLAGKTVLVYSEPGFIDEIQFARFVPQVARLGGAVTVMVQEPLRALFQSLHGVSSVTALGAAVPPHDISVSMMSLPHLLDVRGDTIPVEPYLSADPKSAATWAERMEGVKGRKIGVAWIGGQESGILQGRPLTPETLAALRLPGVTLISLQQRTIDEKLPGLVSPGLMTDFAMAAGLIANLDLVISVDAAVAHLAAAMGKPVWLLLPIIPDAPWSVTGDTHPWYPTMRVFRQRRKGNWDEVIKRVGRELKEIS
jgi:Tfp pilus assembly protein PilF